MKKTCLDRGVTHLPSYHGLLWATAEPNFLHLLVKLGKPFTPKTKGWLGHPPTRSNLKPGQGETIRACPNAIVGSVKGVIFFFFSYIHKLRPLELTQLGGWSSIPEWLFFKNGGLSSGKTQFAHFLCHPSLHPAPWIKGYAEFEGVIDNALIVNKEFKQLRYYSFLINGPNVD